MDERALAIESAADGTLKWDAAEWFRPTADNLPVLIWISGADKLCTWFNRSWLDFVGRTLEQELGYGWAENVHADDFDRCLETYVASFDARIPFRMEYRLRRSDGVYRWVLDEGRPLYGNDGDFAGYIGCCLDVTEQKQANEELGLAFERERRIAQTLQSAFLPPYLPKVEGVEFQAVYRPAEGDARIGGDWYNAFVLRDGRIAVSIGDVFGHGLDAAGAMVRLRETLRAVTGFIDDDPGTILESADRAFQVSHPGVIASAVFAIYDPSTRRMLTANAGHPQPTLVQGGTTMLLPSGDVLLGISPDSTFRVVESQLEPGDAYVLYTDGLIEVERDFIEGQRRLLRSLLAKPLDAGALVTSLTANKQQDDVAMLILSVRSLVTHASWRFQSDDAETAHHARNAFKAHLQQRKLEPERIEAAVLVFGELVANVVRHAPGPIEVELHWENGHPILYVRDRGPSFVLKDPALPSDPLAESGRGLYLVRTFASLKTVGKRSGGGNELCVRLGSPLSA